MTELVCLASAAWQVTPTRTQHLLSRMRDAEVVYFEPPPAADSRAWRKPGRRVRPGVTVYTLPPISEIHPRLAFLSRRDLRRQAVFVQEMLQEHGFRAPVLWAASPAVLPLAEQLAYRGMVYDCQQYWSKLAPELESEMALAADVIFAASAGLADRLAPCNENIVVLPNGSNYPMFSRTDLDLPPCIAELRGVKVGFSGTLWADLDLAPVAAVAEAHPDWAILLLGRVERGARVAQLEAYPNVRVLGQRSLVDVPDYVARFDVCLDLRRTGTPGDDVIPMRVYEYLSAARPVVSMHFKGQIPEHPDVMFAAYSAEECVEQCERALQPIPAWVAERRREFAAASAWSARAEQAMEILTANGLYGG